MHIIIMWLLELYANIDILKISCFGGWGWIEVIVNHLYIDSYRKTHNLNVTLHSESFSSTVFKFHKTRGNNFEFLHANIACERFRFIFSSLSSSSDIIHVIMWCDLLREYA